MEINPLLAFQQVKNRYRHRQYNGLLATGEAHYTHPIRIVQWCFLPSGEPRQMICAFMPITASDFFCLFSPYDVTCGFYKLSVEDRNVFSSFDSALSQVYQDAKLIEIFLNQDSAISFSVSNFLGVYRVKMLLEATAWHRISKTLMEQHPCKLS